MTRRYRCTLESLQSVDEGAGEVVDALRRTGELDDTLIVFTSDNGFFYGEHRITGGKLRHYEEATRVPLLIRGPGIDPGSASTTPVVNADLAPTLLDAAGVEPPHELDGISLLPYAAAGATRIATCLLESRHYAGVHTRPAGPTSSTAPGGLARALRPRRRPVRAAQPRRAAAAVRSVRGGPGRAPRRAARLRRAELPLSGRLSPR